MLKHFILYLQELNILILKIMKSLLIRNIVIKIIEQEKELMQWAMESIQEN